MTDPTAESEPGMEPRPRAEPTARHRVWPGLVRAYCRLTLAFVVGLYLPWAAGAPDLPRHFGEAVHSWAILFFAPVAAWRLVADAVVRRRAGPADPPQPG